MQMSYMEVNMLKTASLTVRVNPETRHRLDNLTSSSMKFNGIPVRRPKSRRS